MNIKRYYLLKVGRNGQPILFSNDCDVLDHLFDDLCPVGGFAVLESLLETCEDSRVFLGNPGSHWNRFRRCMGMGNCGGRWFEV